MEFLSGIQKGRTIIHWMFLNGFFIQENRAPSVSGCVCSGAVHTVRWFGTWLRTIPTLTAVPQTRLDAQLCWMCPDLWHRQHRMQLWIYGRNGNLSYPTRIDVGTGGISNDKKMYTEGMVCCSSFLLIYRLLRRTDQLQRTGSLHPTCHRVNQC
jgi:hypothetical protein